MALSGIFSADKIFTGEDWLENHAVVAANGIIESVIPITALSSNQNVQQFHDCIIAPAMIDLQIYGAGGKLFSADPGTASLRLLVEYCRKGGAAWCQPTAATNTLAVFHQCIDAVRQYWQEGGDGIIGLHLEGPWINPVRRGAHIEDLIRTPTLEEVRSLLDYGTGVIKMITLAPERCTGEILSLIRSYGVVISAGHSDATYEEGRSAFANGVEAATHLFNAMSPLHHREPGLVGAILDDPAVRCSIIPDGFHVDFAAIRVAKSAMGARLFAITDAVTDTETGPYPHQAAGEKYEAAGVLSGSALTMSKAMRNLVEFARVEPAEALRMCSLYPARVMGMDSTHGMIAPGYICTLVVLDHNLETVQII